MQQGDDEGPPAAPPPRFPFMKRGTGTQKYSGVTYPKPKTSESKLRPSATSISSGYPSTSGYADVNIPQNTEFSNAQPSPPMYGSVPDSGRGSAAPPEPIYALPSTRSVESGYGGYDNSSPRSRHTSPGRGRAASASTDDEVFLSDNQEQASPASRSMQSFIRNEQAVERETAEESGLSTPTRRLRELAEIRQPFFNNRSQASNASYSVTDGSVKGDDGPLSSTPIDFTSTNHAQGQADLLNGRRLTEEGVAGSSSPLSGHASDNSSSQPESSATPVSESYQLQPPSDDSLSSARKLIAPNDRPLHHIFPDRQHDLVSETPIVPPSKSTQHQAHLPSKDDDLRRRVLENGMRSRNEKISANVYSTVSSDDSVQTPLRHILPKTNDPVAKELRRQLRDSIAHMDLGHVHLKDQLKKVDKLRYALTNEIERYNELRTEFDEERNAWLLEQKREQESYRKDRISLQRREEEFRKQQNEKEQEMSKQIVANRQSVAQMRIQMNKKDLEIKRLTGEIESKDQMKTRLEKTFEQHKTTHGRELKKLREEIADLQKQLTQSEKTSTKQKIGLHSRNTIKTPRSAASQTLRSSLPHSEPLEDSYVNDARQSQTLPLQMEHLMLESTPRKQVQFNLDKNIVYKDISLPDLSAFQPSEIMELPTGVCRSFVDDKNEVTYLYDLKHLNGRTCGAKIFKYPNNDAKWVYGPIQLYLYHKFPLVIKIACIDVVIKVFHQCVEIHRESIDYMEVSKLDRENETLTELRQRRDGAGYYAYRFSTKTDGISSFHGNSDRSQDEDMITLRRGTVQDPREYVNIKKNTLTGIGYNVCWVSRSIPSAVVKEYCVVSDAELGTKIEITLPEESINISACPESDWVVIRHQKDEETKEPCCDLGKGNRDRERRGEFIAMGNITRR